MRLATMHHQGRPRLAVEGAEGWLILSPQVGNDVGEWLAAGAPEIGFASGEQAPVSPRWLPPVLRPGKILCVGRNYAEHAEETGSNVPQEPLIFSKLVTSLTGHESSIRLPAESSQVDFEAELVVVIGKSGRRIEEQRAMDHIAGYCCGHDVSARDWQKGKPGGQWLLGKSFDGFGPLGPFFVTRDEISDPHQLEVTLRLNGERMQSGTTRDLIFRLPRLISYISSVCSLMPGDLIFTGTPAGVGLGRTPPLFLKPGDVTEVAITGLGTLRNHFVADSDA